MKNGQKVFLSILFFLLANFLSCSNPVVPDEVDPGLVGEWYYTYGNSQDYPSPETFFYGIQINPDKTINLLGIETNTGKVAIQEKPYENLKKGNNGEFVLLVPIEGAGQVSQTFTYKIENEKLILSGEDQNFIYIKTELGVQLYEPVVSDFSFKKDTTLYENKKIFSHPSAFLSKKSTSEFSLNAIVNNNAILTVKINNFNGEGEYKIPYDKLIFEKSSGDVIAIEIFDSSSTGSLTITSYDEINDKCSGTFYFTSTGSGYPGTPTTTFREGIFTVPVYK